MKIKIFIGVRTELGYAKAKEFSDMAADEKRNASNQMQMQIADSIGYRKCPAAATARAHNK